MSIRNALRKAASLIVELPPEEARDASLDSASSVASPESVASTPAPAPAPRTVEQIVKESPGPNLDEIKIAPEPAAAVSAPGGKVEFAAVYQRAGLPAVSFGAEQALEVISSLPAELPLAVKRSTVQATLSAMGKAMGVDTEQVLADASRKLAALAAYGDALTHQTNSFVGASEAKIAELEKQIAEHRATIEQAKALLAEALGACETESERLDDVLEFFTQDVAPSKFASS